ncbi:hypothetical protein DXG01_007806 [Tephrocybe rancida]|nr:hypothetical protein DXG01_007806 [Tephrocybe rancida]
MLRNFPSWFPGTYYATYARKSAHFFEQLLEYPFRQVQEQMVCRRKAEGRESTARPSFVASQLEALHANGQVDDVSSTKQIKLAAAAAYSAGAETCQARAQEEINAVIGSDRLPDFADRENLLYVECVLQETMRWNLAAPTGIPRKAVEDDVYNGMFIPKDSTVITNFR